MIINQWPKTFTSLYSHFWPASYMCLDTEYTGGNASKDLIMEIGHCIVEDGKVVDRLNLVLDWSRSPVVPNHWLRSRLNHQRLQMGDKWRITWEVMKQEGIDPIEALSFYYDLFAVWSDRDLPFVAHNGYTADERMLAGSFEGFLQKPFTFGDQSLIDTGAIHKATLISQSSSPDLERAKLKAVPKSGDSMRSYFKRVAGMHAKGIYWNVKSCLEYYGLIEKYSLDEESFHSAGFDAYCTHLLMEEYRSRVTHNHGPGSGIESPEAFARTIEEGLAESKLEQERADAAVQTALNGASTEARRKLREARQSGRRRRQRKV